MNKENEDKRIMKKEYEVVTREELAEKIKKDNLRVSCYFTIMALDCEDGYDAMAYFFTESPMPISGASIYYDTDFEADSDINNGPGLNRMMDNIKKNDVVILKKLEDLALILNMGFLEFLMKLYILKTELYIIDYENENFIKININLLLIHLLEETGIFYSNLFDECDELSIKYYDGKL